MKVQFHHGWRSRFAPRASRAARLGLFVCAAAAGLASCSSTDRRAVERPVPLSARPVLPYRVFLDRVSVTRLDPGRGSASMPYAAEEHLSRTFAGAILRGLVRSRSFVRVDSAQAVEVSAASYDSPFRYLEAVSADESSDVEARRGSSDLILRAKVGSYVDSMPRAEVDGGAATGSVFVWLFTMFPAWFIEDCTYEPFIYMTISAEQSGRATGKSVAISSERTSLDFIERADVGQYFLQFVCPPVAIPSDSDVARASLLDRSLEQLEAEVARRFAGRMAIERVVTQEPFLLPTSVDASYLFLPAEISALEVDGQVPPEIAVDPSAYLQSDKIPGASRGGAFERLRRYLGSAAPDETVPDVEVLDRLYAHVYRLPYVAAGPKDRRVTVRYQVPPRNETQSVTWTLPAVQPGGLAPEGRDRYVVPPLDPDPVPVPVPDPEPVPDPATVPDPDPVPLTAPAPGAPPGDAGKPDAQPAPPAEAPASPAPEPKAGPTPQPEPKAEPQPEPSPKPQPESPPASPVASPVAGRATSAPRPGAA